ncbi:MAG: DUF4097 family beta strand repeat protein [Candidatus Sabulitectum sp.]|nr:DUF4097 family beta strand repeat protein [Candidatus Sabulitectum sp.]
MKYRMFVLSAACLIASCVVIKLNRDLLEVRTNEFEMAPGSELSFYNTNGDLEVAEWESDFILIETSIYGDSGRGIPEGLDIRFDEFEDHLSATVDYPGRNIFSSVDFSVKIPFDMEYTVNQTTTNGETLIIGAVFANVETTNGDIHVEVLSSHSLTTTNGDITALLYRQNDVVTVETTNGDILIELPDLIGINVKTRNGDIVVEGVKMDDDVFIDGDWIARIETTNGDICVTRTNAF